MKVFTSNEFIDKLNWLVYDVPNYYHSQAGTWCNYNSSNGKFMMDCVVSIKGLLWGFKADANLPHGGGIYASNGVADFGANQGINYCEDASQDFNDLVPGEYLCMKGTQYEHAGVYLGNGKVFECTTGWGVNRCIISDIDSNGGRYLNGVRNLRWTWHGKLIYIDYEDIPTPEPEPSEKNRVMYQAYTNRWLPDVVDYNNYDDNGYAGIYGQPISCIRANAQRGDLIYKVHTKNYGWLGEIKNREPEYGYGDDYAGIKGKPIDGIMIKCTEGTARYRVHLKGGNWLGWITEYNENDAIYGYAGILGKEIDAVQIEII